MCNTRHVTRFDREDVGDDDWYHIYDMIWYDMINSFLTFAGLQSIPSPLININRWWTSIWFDMFTDLNGGRDCTENGQAWIHILLDESMYDECYGWYGDAWDLLVFHDFALKIIRFKDSCSIVPYHHHPFYIIYTLLIPSTLSIPS